MAHRQTSSYFQNLQHPSKNRQGDILIAATDVFAQNPRPSQKEYKQYSELFYSLIANCNRSAKRLIAATLANCTFAPRLSVFYLALADVSIAAPVLAFSNVFTALDLTELIGKTTPHHHRILATRTDLTTDHIDQLSAIGDDVVALRLLNNQSLTLAKEHNNLLMALSKKDNFTKEKNAAALKNKNAEAIQELLSLANVGGRIKKKAPQNIAADPALDEAFYAHADLKDSQRMSLFHVALFEACESQDRQKAQALTENYLDISSLECDKIFNDFTADTFAIIAKATNLDPVLALRSAKALFTNLAQNHSLSLRFEKIYQILDRATCLSAVKQWQDLNRPAHGEKTQEPILKIPPIAHAPQLQSDGASHSRLRFDNRNATLLAPKVAPTKVAPTKVASSSGSQPGRANLPHQGEKQFAS